MACRASILLKTRDNDCRISSPESTKGDIFTRVTHAGFKALPQSTAEKQHDLLKTEHTLHSAHACQRDSFNKRSQQKRVGRSPIALQTLQVRRKHLGFGIFLQPRKHMIMFKFPAKGNKESLLPIQLYAFTFIYKYPHA